jgi:hypothetical protein
LFQNVLDTSKQHALNRSHHVLPMNLSKIEFDRKANDYETRSHLQKTAHFRETTSSKPAEKNFTIKEISDFCMRVSLIINDMMISEADPKASNLENTRPDGRVYELVPNSFVLYTHHKIPQIIKNEIE